MNLLVTVSAKIALKSKSYCRVEQCSARLVHAQKVVG